MIGANNLIKVFFGREQANILMGRLAFKNRQIFFEYDQGFLATGLEPSPFKLPAQAGVHVCADFIFEGLFGVFNDSLPDGWGRLLLDRQLGKIGINPKSLTPLDRLLYVGNRGMGALSYQPAFDPWLAVDPVDLDAIADECWQFQMNDEEQFVEDLLYLNGSSAGARPKILLKLEPDNTDWIIKFASSTDPKDIGPIEYAYSLMAQASGLNVPEARLFKSQKGPGFFGVKRFDKAASRPVHMHTASGLLHADHRMPSLDYDTLMKTCMWLCKDSEQHENLLRWATFNVLAHNRDDHAKNFSFLMNNQGDWKLSPAYDLTLSSGPAGEHCTTVMGEGKNPGVEHLLKLASVGGISKNRCQEIIETVKNAISRWLEFAELAQVARSSRAMIERALN